MTRKSGIKVQAGGVHMDYDSWRMTSMINEYKTDTVILLEILFLRLSWAYSNAKFKRNSYSSEISTKQWGANF